MPNNKPVRIQNRARQCRKVKKKGKGKMQRERGILLTVSLSTLARQCRKGKREKVKGERGKGVFY